MRYDPAPLRSGMTAIAAVIALTSTPLIAQTIESAPASPAPTVIAPPPPVMTSAPSATPSTALPTAQPDSATIPGTHVPRITLNLDEPAPAAAESAPTHRAARTSAKKTTVVHTARPTATPVAAATAAKTAEAAPKPIAAPPPVSHPAAAKADPAPTATVSTAASSTTTSSDGPAIAGIAGVGALALAAGAIALGRRRRRDEEPLAYEAPIDPVATAPMVETDGVNTPVEVVRPLPVAASTLAETGADLPAGFDLSRFGPHVQAAYRGPTEDNPSLSLKKRLARARFFDQRERIAAETAPAQAEQVPDRTGTYRWANIMPAKLSRPRKPTLRPIFSN